MAVEKIQDCPSCGNSDILVEEHVSFLNDDMKYRVWCTKCKASTEYHSTKNSSIEEWNDPETWNCRQEKE